MPTVNARPGKLDIATTFGDDLSVVLTHVDSNGTASAVAASWTCLVLDRPGGSTLATITVTRSGASSNILTLTLADVSVTQREAVWYLHDATNDRAWLGGKFTTYSPGEGTGSTPTNAATVQVTTTSVTVTTLGAASGSSVALDDLTDVTITAAASGDILRHNGTAWVDAVGTTHFDAAGSAAAAQAASQPLDSDLTAIAALTTTAYGRALLELANAAAGRTALGLVIGTDVQAQDAELAAIAGLTSAADSLPYFTGSGTAALTTLTTAGRALLDDANAAAQRTTLDVPSTSEAILDTLIDAKGDLIVGTAADTPARLAVGATNGHVLTVDSAEAAGVKWAAATSSNYYAPEVSRPDATHGHFYFLGGSHTAQTLAEGEERGYLIWLPSGTLTQIGAQVTGAGSAGAVVRLGVRQCNHATIPRSPGTSSLVVDAGTINGTSATYQRITGLSVTITGGWHYLVAVCQGSAATRPTMAVINGLGGRTDQYFPDDISSATEPTRAFGNPQNLLINTGVSGALSADASLGSGGIGVVATYPPWVWVRIKS